MKRCAIISGADISDYETVRSYLRDDDYIIVCDCGLRHMEKLKISADLAVGDFDSHEKPTTNVETIALPCEKDDTDTVFAVKEALSRGYTDFLILGAVGNRLDHTLGNVSILLMLDSLGKHGVIVDDYSEMEIVSDKSVFIDDSFSYFSVLNISGKAEGVTIKNAKYPLDDGIITCEYQYGISNEVMKGKTAQVCVRDGRLLLVKVRCSER